ncbi:DUF1043 family protein [Alteromonadaceae bacterium BrNp21-10]|nr:DUF1043 family protein [Alteromonadaceae bacterium BrNp21-10]
MEIIINLVLIVAGAVIGFFAAKYWFTQRSQPSSEDQAELTIKELLAQQTSSHLLESRQMLAVIEQQCAALKSQFDHFEANVVLSEDEQDDQERLTFFGDQANAYLRNKGSKSKSTHSSADFQPLDYAGGNSGVFSGSKKSTVQAND